MKFEVKLDLGMVAMAIAIAYSVYTASQAFLFVEQLTVDAAYATVESMNEATEATIQALSDATETTVDAMSNATDTLTSTASSIYGYIFGE